MRSLVLVCVLCGSARAARYELEPLPRIRFLVEGPLDDVEGFARSGLGDLTLDPAHWGEVTARLSVDLRTMRTGIDTRDEDMRDQFLETTKFPRALLEITRVENASSPGLIPGGTVDGDAVGSLELHGQRRAVRFRLRLQTDSQGHLVATGGFPVVLADYGIHRPERLFLKLGSVAQVQFEATFRPTDAVAPLPTSERGRMLTPTVSNVLALLPAPPRPVRRPRPSLQTSYTFPDDPRSALSRGERLFHSPSVGGEGNALSCGHCHARTDERNGQIQPDGHVRAAHSLFGAAQRPRFWNGFAETLPKAVQLCAKVNLRRPNGLPAQVVDDLSAYIASLSVDSAPELDYRVLYRTLESPLRDPQGGDVARGRSLGFRYCMTCHLNGRAAPPLLPGLYDAEWVVRRVRRLEGHQDRQEPPFSMDRLPDSELRDIVTWLTSPKSAPPVFPRNSSKDSPSASAGR
jgi:mono/diheme cytochrome c family protein/polyisoprenoid-binding protein YceI